MSCEHKYIHLETRYIRIVRGYGRETYKRIERFFCEKCCDEKIVAKEESNSYTPEWFKIKDCEVVRD